jgi:hypothetical protein
MAKRLDPELVAQRVYRREEQGQSFVARRLRETFEEQAQGDDWEDFIRALDTLRTYGVF